MYNETEKCELDAISDIFSKAIDKQNMSKSNVEKMITETKNEVQKNMNVYTLRNAKVALKALLMKNVRIDTQGRVLISKDDEWREETEWNTLYEEISDRSIDM